MGILTIDKLMKMGQSLVNICFLCKRDGESYNHVLLWCLFVYKCGPWFMGYWRSVGCVRFCEGRDLSLEGY